jgi:hypothetical protein
MSIGPSCAVHETLEHLKLPFRGDEPVGRRGRRMGGDGFITVPNNGNWVLTRWAGTGIICVRFFRDIAERLLCAGPGAARGDHAPVMQKYLVLAGRLAGGLRPASLVGGSRPPARRGGRGA